MYLFTYLRSGLVGICGSISVLCHHQLLCRSRHVMHGVHHDLINWMFLFEFLFIIWSAVDAKWKISRSCHFGSRSISWVRKAPIPATLVFPGWVHRPCFQLRLLLATIFTIVLRVHEVGLIDFLPFAPTALGDSPRRVRWVGQIDSAFVLRGFSRDWSSLSSILLLWSEVNADRSVSSQIVMISIGSPLATHVSQEGKQSAAGEWWGHVITCTFTRTQIDTYIHT